MQASHLTLIRAGLVSFEPTGIFFALLTGIELIIIAPFLICGLIYYFEFNWLE